MKKEGIASSVLGVLALSALDYCFIKIGRVAPYVTIFAFAFGMEAIALALAPGVLFERVTYGHLTTGGGSRRYGFAAAFSLLAKLCMILGLVFFLLSMLLERFG